MPFRRAVPGSSEPAAADALPPAVPEPPDAAELVLAALDDERVITAIAEIVRETDRRDETKRTPAASAGRAAPQRKGAARG